ncbi:MAG: hypothetical protein J3Q66DRAFT_327608, partial [Benniella sp.]
MRLDSAALPPPLQGFQVGNSDVLYIKSRRNNTTGQCIILWKDILQAFGDVKHVRDGPTIVSFVTDDDFEFLEPLRIDYHPDVTLEVVLNDDAVFTAPGGPVDVTPAPASTSASNLPEDDSDINIQPSPSIASASTPAATLQQMDTSTPSSASTSQSIIEDLVIPQTSRLQVSQSATDANMLYTGPERPSSSSSLSKGREYERLDGSAAERTMILDEARDSSKLQAALAISEPHPWKEPTMMEKDRSTLEDLVAVQNRIHAVLNQTYGFHTPPVPQLFVALPKVHKMDPQTRKKTLHDFRLFFLCDCGPHTETVTAKRHEIHLAHHVGYDVVRPNDLFEVYGEQILALLEMIKYGVVAPFKSGLASIAQQDTMNKLEELYSAHGFSTYSLESLVDDTIEYIQAQLNNGAASNVPDKLELNEGLDLGKLEYFLDTKNQAHTFGDLYRVITDKGYIKWVCQDHYRERYPLPLKQQLDGTPGFGNAIFAEETGRVSVNIADGYEAEEVYEGLANVHGLQELMISLGWTIDSNDLGLLALAIATSTIDQLIIHGSRVRSSDMMESEFWKVEMDYWFDPIVRSLYHSVLSDNDSIDEDLTEGKDHAFSHQWESLVLDRQLREEERGDAFYQMRVMRAALQPMLVKLKLLTIRRGTYTLHVSLSQGEVSGIVAEIISLSDILDVDKPFLLDGHLTSISIKKTPDAKREALLKDLLSQSTKLSRLYIGCHALRVFPLIDIIIAARRNVVRQKSLNALSTFELQQDDGPESRDIESIYGRITCSGKFAVDSSVPDLSIHFAARFHDTVYQDIFERYGSSIVSLDSCSSITDDMALSFDKTTRQKDPKLTSLILDTESLSLTGAHYMRLVIQRSRWLSKLGLYFEGLEDKVNQEKAAELLNPFKKRLNVLRLSGTSSHTWIPKIKDLCATRDDLPQLESLELVHKSLTAVPHSYAQWLVAMVSSPPGTAADVQGTWRPLKCIRLENMSCVAKDWGTIIEAIDLTYLETLSFENSDVGLREFGVLINRFSDGGHGSCEILLKSLNLQGTDLSRVQRLEDFQELTDLSLKLRAMVPMLDILGLSVL